MRSFLGAKNERNGKRKKGDERWGGFGDDSEKRRKTCQSEIPRHGEGKAHSKRKGRESGGGGGIGKKGEKRGSEPDKLGKITGNHLRSLEAAQQL